LSIDTLGGGVTLVPMNAPTQRRQPGRPRAEDSPASLDAIVGAALTAFARHDMTVSYSARSPGKWALISATTHPERPARPAAAHGLNLQVGIGEALAAEFISRAIAIARPESV